MDVDAAGGIRTSARGADRAHDRLEQVDVLVGEDRRDDLAVLGAAEGAVVDDLPGALLGVDDLVIAVVAAALEAASGRVGDGARDLVLREADDLDLDPEPERLHRFRVGHLRGHTVESGVGEAKSESAAEPLNVIPCEMCPVVAHMQAL